MRRKHLKASTTLSPYGTDLTVVFSSDLVAAGEELGVENAESLAESTGFVVAQGNTVGLVVDSKCLSYGTVAHEAQHVVYCVFKFIEQSLEGSEEPACYLLQHIVEYVLAEAKKRRVPVK